MNIATRPTAIRERVVNDPEAPPETYLGDGLYASFDGYHIWLRAPRQDGDHRVALEPAVFDRLIEYRRSNAS